MDVSNSESTLLTSQERPTVTLMHYLGDPVGAKVVEVIVVGVVVVKVVAVVGIGIVVAKVVKVMIVMGIVVMKVTLRSTMLMVMVLPS